MKGRRNQAQTLSRANVAQMDEMAYANATSRERAIAVKSAAATSRLVNLGLADKRTHKPRGGSQCTLYWLTAAGVRRWTELAS